MFYHSSSRDGIEFATVVCSFELFKTFYPFKPFPFFHPFYPFTFLPFGGDRTRFDQHPLRSKRSGLEISPE